MIWVFVVLLVSWGNVGSSLLAPTALLPGGSPAFVAAGAGLSALALVVARAAGLDRSALGLARAGMWRGAAVGLVSGAAIAAAGILALQVAPLVTGAPVVYEPLRSVSGPELAAHILLFLPLATVLPEELAFRGVLVGMLGRTGPGAALLGSAAAFALWHGAVALATVDRTTLASTAWVAPAVAGALAVVFVGGLVLAWLRLATATLGSAIAAHWAFNATLLLGLWMLLPRPGGAG